MGAWQFLAEANKGILEQPESLMQDLLEWANLVNIARRQTSDNGR